MGMAAPLYYSAEMVRALPDDGNRYETVHGELLVTPAPRADHQYVVTNLVARLWSYLARYPIGQVLPSPADISWAPDVLVQPDVFVVAIAEARTFDWKRMRTLLLGCRGSQSLDQPLRPLHQAAGVSGVWRTVVLDGEDIEGRAAEIWTADATSPRIERERLVWEPPRAAEPLVIPLDDILPPQGRPRSVSPARSSYSFQRRAIASSARACNTAASAGLLRPSSR